MISKIHIKTPFQRIVLGITFFVLGNSLLNFQSNIITAVLCTIGLLYILYTVVLIKSWYFPLNGVEGLLYKLYMLLVIIMIIRGYMIDYSYQWISLQGLINFHFFSPFYILPYFLPLLIFIGIKRIEFRTLLKLNNLFNLIFLVFFIFNIRTIYYDGLKQVVGVSDQNGWTGLASPTASFFTATGFFVLCKDFISKRQWIFNLLMLLLAIITFAIGARRGGVFMLLLLAISVAFMYIQSFKGRTKIIGTISILIVVLLLIGAYSQFENTVFRFINERGFEDSRSVVDSALLSQMNEFQLWFGKGLNGRYYLPLLQDDYLNGWRYGTETGFYNLVLKGGYVFALIYILVLLIPALKGIFMSKNSFTKALGIYILLSLVELYPFGWLKFDLKFFIIWLGVVLCWSPSIRRLNNWEIKKRFF